MRREWADVSRRELSALVETMSGIEIAREYGVHHNAVYHRLRTLGVKCSKKRRRFDPPREELESHYRKKSMADIATHYGVGETVVFKRLKEHGIGGISRSDRLSGKPKSLEHRLALSRSTRASGVRSGERNGNWKGGKSSANKRARSRAAYFDWKRDVLAAAEWKCAVCGSEHGSICGHCGHRVLLHAHHVVSFADDESMRYVVSNGKALCESCHRLEHHETA